MNPYVPFTLLILGLVEMTLKDLSVLPTPHVVSTIIAVVCVVLSLVTLVMYAGLKFKETGKRGRP